MHFCSMVQTKPHYGSWKTLIKPLEIVQIGLRRLQNVIIKVLHFFTYLSNSVKWAPRAPGERPKALRGPPIAPTSIKINVNEPKSMQNWKLKISRAFRPYISYVFTMDVMVYFSHSLAILWYTWHSYSTKDIELLNAARRNARSDWITRTAIIPNWWQIKQHVLCC